MPGPIRKIRSTHSELLKDESGSLLVLITFLFIFALILVISIIDIGGFYIEKRELTSINEGALSTAIQSLDQSAYYQTGVDPNTGRVPLDCYTAYAKLSNVLALVNLNGSPIYLDSWHCENNALYVTTSTYQKPIIPMPFLTNLYQGNGSQVKIDATIGETSQITP